MKTSLLLCLLLATALSRGLAAPLDSTIVYQGRLTDAGSPANGTYDLRFTLYDAVNGGNPVGGLSTSDDLSVANGLFNATLDFGFTPFDGMALWLELAVRPGNSAGAYVALTPRQPMTTAPYALYAVTAARAYSSTNVTANGVNNAALQDATITGGKIAGGQVVKSFNGLHDAVSLLAGDNITLTPNGQGITIAAPGVDDDWHLLGNLGTTPGVNFLGTTDNQPLELRVNNSRVLRLQPDTSPQNAPSILGGSPVNLLAPGIVGATIAGGGSADYEGNGPFPNTVGLSYGTVGGGVGNDTAGVGATIGGGYNNTSVGFFATVGGGGVNLANGDHTFVGGGLFNQATNTGSTVAGGRNNRATGIYSSVGGGTNVQALGDYSSVAGGRSNVSGGNYAAIGGGNGNTSSGIYSTTAGGRFNRSTSFVTTVGGGDNNEASYTFATVGGGHDNTANNTSATVGGGGNNTSSDVSATVGGGSANTASAAFATVGGGDFNGSSGLSATVGGGNGNESSGDYSTVAGGSRNVSSGSAATVGGGLFNQATNIGSTVAGGRNNLTRGIYSTIAGGADNIIQTNAPYATIPGGHQAAAANYGQIAYASGHFVNPGDAQTSVYVVRTITSSNNVSRLTELFLDGASQRIRVPRDSTWAFDIMVVGRNAGTSSAMFHFHGLIQNSGGVTVIPIPTGPDLISSYKDNGQWFVRVIADDDNDALVIRAVSNGSLNPMDPPVRWVATVRTTEVVFP